METNLRFVRSGAQRAQVFTTPALRATPPRRGIKLAVGENGVCKSLVGADIIRPRCHMARFQKKPATNLPPAVSIKRMTLDNEDS